MTPPKRPYVPPIVHCESFRLGVYGSYDALETLPYLPVPPLKDGGLSVEQD